MKVFRKLGRLDGPNGSYLPSQSMFLFFPGRMDPSSHSMVLLQQLNLQREFGFLCDCTVAIGDVYFKAHRAVLASFSNYFKMIFIHQSSECIKIQPTDIQPDIFSFLLHVMYTGKCPKQTVDHFRLEEGMRFLHTSLLSPVAKEPTQIISSETMHSSNLYGIQISTAQKVPKETIKHKEKPSNTARPDQQGEHPQLQLSLAIGLEGVSPEQQSSHFTGPVSTPVKSMEEIQKTEMCIKQETSDPDTVTSPSLSLTALDNESHFRKTGNRIHACHYCGEHFDSRVTLRDHLHIHVSQSLPFGVPSSILEGDDHGEVRPILDNIENTENYRLGNYLLNRSDESLESVSHQEQLQLNQLSFLSKDSDPIELNCNLSFLRKRKFSCAVCGHKFIRRSQMLEHLCTHKTKLQKLNKYQKFGYQMERTLQTYCDGVADSNQKVSGLSQDSPEFPGAPDLTAPQENVQSVVTE
ncbi:zinc finger and BTB domain-containing 25 isoform X1 [Pelobates cultripes]|uniref:Zinc finger and BTB domain-containing 25 isoform X1 n=1 Tax=Pelobates cultripes TaxID=61616 RepID=A0AAD1TNZ0_PELCU|nr:zinc finger and BTB domain-containing 25 isoform X1 [Pelobates cultripes]